MWKMWAWGLVRAWWAAEAVVGCVGLGLLGLLVASGSWALGRLCRVLPPMGGPVGRVLRAELAGMAVALWWAAPGKRRLAALQRLANFAREQSRRWDEAHPDWHFWGPVDPDLEVDPRLPPRRCMDLAPVVAECLLESPSEAAPLVPCLTDNCSPDLTLGQEPSEDWRLGWERFFSEASLARLRGLLLTNEDPAVVKAVLSLFACSSQALPCFQYRQAWATSSAAWAVMGRASLARLQAFLRDPDVLAKLRGLLSGGDPHRLLDPAFKTFSAMVGGEPASIPHPHYRYDLFSSFGPFQLARPILHDLAHNFDKLGDHWHPYDEWLNLRFSLSPEERPEEAVEAVEGFLLPWLARAEELSPACLRWLISAFPSKDGKWRYYCTQNNITVTADLEPWACQLGRRLRSAIVAAAMGVLKDRRLSPAQLWSFVMGLAEPMFHQQNPPAEFLGSVELFRRASVVCCRLPVTPATFTAVNAAAATIFDALRDKAGSGLAVRSGGFRTLVELLRELTNDYRQKVDWLPAFLDTAKLFLGLPHHDLPDQDLSRGEVTERLLHWRDSGFGDALRALLPTLCDFEGGRVQGLLDLHDDLLRRHPFPRFSRLPLEIRFPLH